MLSEKNISDARAMGYVACLIFDNTKGTRNHAGIHLENMRNGIVYFFYKHDELDTLQKTVRKLSSEFFIPAHTIHF